MKFIARIINFFTPPTYSSEETLRLLLKQEHSLKKMMSQADELEELFHQVKERTFRDVKSMQIFSRIKKFFTPQGMPGFSEELQAQMLKTEIMGDNLLKQINEMDGKRMDFFIVKSGNNYFREFTSNPLMVTSLHDASPYTSKWKAEQIAKALEDLGFRAEVTKLGGSFNLGLRHRTESGSKLIKL